MDQAVNNYTGFAIEYFTAQRHVDENCSWRSTSEGPECRDRAESRGLGPDANEGSRTHDFGAYPINHTRAQILCNKFQQIPTIAGVI